MRITYRCTHSEINFCPCYVMYIAVHQFQEITLFTPYTIGIPTKTTIYYYLIIINYFFIIVVVVVVIIIFELLKVVEEIACQCSLVS